MKFSVVVKTIQADVDIQWSETPPAEAIEYDLINLLHSIQRAGNGAALFNDQEDDISD